MGHKVHPTSFRIGTIYTWRSQWYADQDYAKLLREDRAIRDFLADARGEAGISRVEIERNISQLTVSIHTAKPGIVIGRGGQKVDELRTDLEKLTGRRVRTLDDARDAATVLLERGCRAVLVKGGHLAAAPATDLLVTPTEEHVFPGELVPTAGASGTGCTYAAAIATHLGRGAPLIDAIDRAKRYVTDAIRHPAFGAGAGPMDHFHALRDGRGAPSGKP